MGKILELVMKYEMGNNQQNSKDKDKTDENMQNNDTIERLIMILCDTDNIKDVVAFPKTASAYCLMTDAPNVVDEKQLKDLGIGLR